MITLTSD